MSEYKARFDVEVENVDDLQPAIMASPEHIRDEDYQADNTARASFAATALVAFVKRVGENEMETNVSDLLADLMHLSDALGIDFDNAVYAGRNHYEAEIRGEL